MNLKSQKFEASQPIAPGVTVLDVLNDRGISQIELAKRLDRPKKTVNGIIKGKVAITPEIALQLEHVFGIPANFWNNLESQYQEAKLRIESQQEVDTEDFNYNKPSQKWLESTFDFSKDEDTGAFWLSTGILIGMVVFIIGFIVWSL